MNKFLKIDDFIGKEITIVSWSLEEIRFNYRGIKYVEFAGIVTEITEVCYL